MRHKFNKKINGFNSKRLYLGRHGPKENGMLAESAFGETYMIGQKNSIENFVPFRWLFGDSSSKYFIGHTNEARTLQTAKLLVLGMQEQGYPKTIYGLEKIDDFDSKEIKGLNDWANHDLDAYKKLGENAYMNEWSKSAFSKVQSWNQAEDRGLTSLAMEIFPKLFDQNKTVGVAVGHLGTVEPIITGILKYLGKQNISSLKDIGGRFKPNDYAILDIAEDGKFGELILRGKTYDLDLYRMPLRLRKP